MEFFKIINQIPAIVKILVGIVTFPVGSVAVFALHMIAKHAVENGGFSNTDVHTGNSAHDDFMQQELMRQHNEWAMEEARKAATPFDHGGYMQGDGFNPSDTMAAEAQRQMDNMNNMNNMNNMGMF